MPATENIAREKGRRLLGIRINYLYSTVQSIDFFAMKQHESKWTAHCESTNWTSFIKLAYLSLPFIPCTVKNIPVSTFREQNARFCLGLGMCWEVEEKT